MINKPFKVGQHRGDEDVSLFLLYEFVVHARLGDADLTSEEVVEIAEHLERIEDNEEVIAKEVEAAGSSEDETAMADLEEVVDAAVASAQVEESNGESKR